MPLQFMGAVLIMDDGGVVSQDRCQGWQMDMRGLCPMNMDGWDLLLLFVSGYFSVILLIRLMQSHRDRLIADMRQQIKQEQIRSASGRSSKLKLKSAEPDVDDADSQAA